MVIRPDVKHACLAKEVIFVVQDIQRLENRARDVLGYQICPLKMNNFA